MMLSNSSPETINGEIYYALRSISVQSEAEYSGFKRSKYITDYITDLYKQNGKVMPFTNINGQLYYKKP